MNEMNATKQKSIKHKICIDDPRFNLNLIGVARWEIDHKNPLSVVFYSTMAAKLEKKKRRDGK